MQTAPPHSIQMNDIVPNSHFVAIFSSRWLNLRASDQRDQNKNFKIFMAVEPQAWFPFSNGAARKPLLKAICCLAESIATICTRHATDARLCITAVCADSGRRVVRMGGRQGLPRSIGSLYGGLVALFLGSTFTGAVKTVIVTPGVVSWNNGVAVSHDGTTLLVSDGNGGTHAIHMFRIADGAPLRTVGGEGDGPLQFKMPYQVCVAAVDGFVFVAEAANDRIQVLTPQMDFASFVGVGQLRSPVGVCADGEIIAVSELCAHRISVFSRDDDTLLRRFAERGSGDTQLSFPCALCFTADHRHIAVSDPTNDRISVFSTEGKFIRSMVGAKYAYCCGCVHTNSGELVFANYSSVVVSSASGEEIRSLRASDWVTGVAIHCGSMYAQTSGGVCVVFT